MGRVYHGQGACIVTGHPDPTQRDQGLAIGLETPASLAAAGLILQRIRPGNSDLAFASETIY